MTTFHTRGGGVFGGQPLGSAVSVSYPFTSGFGATRGPNAGREAEALSRLTARQRFLHPTNQSGLKDLLEVMLESTKASERALGVSMPDWQEHLFSSFIDEGLLMSGVDENNLQHPQWTSLRHSLFAQARCMEWGNPLYVLDQTCAEALLKTKIPFERLTTEHLETVLRLPFPGLYLQVPRGLFDLLDPQTGLHPVEGIYIASSWDLTDEAHEKAVEATAAVTDHSGATGNSTRARVAEASSNCDCFRCKGAVAASLAQSIERGEYTTTITLAAMGAAKGVWYGDINDTTCSVALCSGMPVNGAPAFFAQSGIEEVMRVALGFLLAYNADYLDAEEVKPRSNAPKKLRKRQRREKRGEVFEAYTRITLGGRARRARSRAQKKGGSTGKALDHQVTVPGHWHRYWVTDDHLGNRPPLGTRTNVHGTTLHRILRWVFPYTKGPAPLDGSAPEGPRYRVRK